MKHTYLLKRKEFVVNSFYHLHPSCTQEHADDTDSPSVFYVDNQRCFSHNQQFGHYEYHKSHARIVSGKDNS